MRNNRIGKCPLADVCDMKKRERGSYDFRSTSNLEIVQWNDNSVVTIGSNACRVEPVRNSKRWVRGKGKGNITQPVVIAAYNRGMGGVNLLDRTLSDLKPFLSFGRKCKCRATYDLNVEAIFFEIGQGCRSSQLI